MKKTITILMFFACFIPLSSKAESKLSFKVRLFERANPQHVVNWSLEVKRNLVAELKTLTTDPKGLMSLSKIDSCADRGGIYHKKISPDLHSKLVSLVQDAIIEQKPLNPTDQKTIRTSSPTESFKLELFNSKKLELVSVMDRNKPKIKSLILALEELYQNMILSPLEAIKMSATGNNPITIQFTNIGKTIIQLPIPEKLRETFELVNSSGKTVAIKENQQQKQRNIELKPKKTHSLVIRPMESPKSTIKLVHYRNHAILHHISKEKNKVELSLCAPLK